MKLADIGTRGDIAKQVSPDRVRRSTVGKVRLVLVELQNRSRSIELDGPERQCVELGMGKLVDLIDNVS